MSFSEDKLNIAAQEIVDSFMKTGDSLTLLVKTKVASAGWNNNQASRLIERVNGEAFLKLFPGRTDFQVAEPEAVTGIKVAMEKVASDKPKTYKSWMEKDPYDIFEVDLEKVSSSCDVPLNYSKLAFLDSIYAEKIGEAIKLKTTEEALNKEAKEQNAYQTVKDAVLYGRPFNEIEVEAYEVFNSRPEKVASTMDTIYAKLAKDTSIDLRLLKRAHVEELDMDRINLENDIVKALSEVIN